MELLTITKNGRNYNIYRGDQANIDALGIDIQFTEEEKEAYQKSTTPPPLTLEEKREQLRERIRQYGSSDAVNVFYLNGEKQPWLKESTRVSMMVSIQLAESQGLTKIKYQSPTREVELDTSLGKQLIGRLMQYANNSFAVEANHLRAAEGLTEAEIDSYDFTVNYPPIPRF